MRCFVLHFFIAYFPWKSCTQGRDGDEQTPETQFVVYYNHELCILFNLQENKTSRSHIADLILVTGMGLKTWRDGTKVRNMDTGDTVNSKSIGYL